MGLGLGLGSGVDSWIPIAKLDPKCKIQNFNKKKFNKFVEFVLICC